MAKFKVGDRVRYVSGVYGWYDTNPRDEIGIIVETAGSYLPLTVKWRAGTNKYNNKDLELVENKTPTYQKLTPKVGDKFKLVKKFIEDRGKDAKMVTVEYVWDGETWAVEESGKVYSNKHFTTEYLEPVESEETDSIWYGQSLSTQLEPITINSDVHQIMQDMMYRMNPARVGRKEPIKKTNTITKMTNFIKKLTQSADDKALEKAGFIDSCGDLTRTGNEALTSLVFQEKKEALVKLANEVIAESKE